MERSYKKLIVWKEADDLCFFIYQITKDFPAEERYALVSQMRRAAYSVPMNLVEGNVRRTSKDRSHFFLIASSSLEELHYQCHLARRLEYISQALFDAADSRIQKVAFLLSKLRLASSKSFQSS